MKKLHKLPGFLPVLLCLAGIMWLPVSVQAKVYDNYGILNEEETTALEKELAEIEEAYQFETAFLITDNVGEEMDYRQYAARFMQMNQVGYGESNEGLCVFHQPDARNITIVFRGKAQDQFTEKIQDRMLDHCTEKLKKDDTLGAYQSIVKDLEQGLSRVSQGKKIRPMDISDTPLTLSLLKWLLISIAAGAVPAFAASWYQKNRMKTNVIQTNADLYAEAEETRFSQMRDMYIRRAVTRRRKPQNKGGNNGSSDSFTSGGESFSGSGRNY